jgi:RHS repeat-associated protein
VTSVWRGCDAGKCHCGASVAGDGKRRRFQESDTDRSFIWDGENVRDEVTSADTLLMVYTLAPRGYGEVVAMKRAGVTSFYHFDALGSTDRLTDSSASTLISYLYRAFGQQTILSGSSANRYTWVGRLGYYRQPDSSDYWVRARVYRPQVGRWVSRDPLWLLLGHLLVWRCPIVYAYACNAPGRRGDPSGLLDFPDYNFFQQWHGDYLWVCKCRESRDVMAYTATFWSKWWRHRLCNCKCYYCMGKDKWTEPGYCYTYKPKPQPDLPLPDSCKRVLGALEGGHAPSELDAQDCCDWIAEQLDLKGNARKAFVENCYMYSTAIPQYLRKLLHTSGEQGCSVA